MARSHVGFAGKGTFEQKGTNKAIERTFSPEFRNRLDKIIYFNGLPLDVVRRVVDKFLHELDGQLTDKKVRLDVTDAARDWLAKKGYDDKFGARPMERVIHEHIKRPLADQLLFGDLQDGGVVQVDVDEDDGLAVTSSEG
jgi:ATP-dependent Clp protease ATP-binding subunit ClpA